MFLPNIGFSIMSLLFPVMFLLVFGTILATLFRGLKEWNKNNHAPRLTVEATVVSKRDHHAVRRGGNGPTRRVTTYYATFQFESGDRMELQLQGQEFGLIVEGDRGKLSFQGTRFLCFERTII